MTHMVKTQVYLREEELEALRERLPIVPVADLVREAIRRVWLRPGIQPEEPVALWDGEPRRTSSEHDTIYDDP